LGSFIQSHLLEEEEEEEEEEETQRVVEGIFHEGEGCRTLS
jgi:hypothetical protein